MILKRNPKFNLKNELLNGIPVLHDFTVFIEPEKIYGNNLLVVRVKF